MGRTKAEQLNDTATTPPRKRRAPRAKPGPEEVLSENVALAVPAKPVAPPAYTVSRGVDTAALLLFFFVHVFYLSIIVYAAMCYTALGNVSMYAVFCFFGYLPVAATMWPISFFSARSSEIVRTTVFFILCLSMINAFYAPVPVLPVPTDDRLRGVFSAVLSPVVLNAVKFCLEPVIIVFFALDLFKRPAKPAGKPTAKT